MILRDGCMLSLFARTPSLLAYHCNSYSRPVICNYLHPIHARRQDSLPINQMRRRLSTATVPLVREQTSSKKKSRRETPEGILRHKFDMCSKNGDVAEALRLYDDARRNGSQLLQHHYNVLLYLCSSVSSGSGVAKGPAINQGLERGFEIFKQMRADGIQPNEATFTSLARLAVAKEDPEMAFDLVKQMKDCGIPPKLRSYGPALFGFCRKGMADKAYEVDTDMVESGVLAEESELSALLKLSSESNRDKKVYEMLHRLRASVRQVTEETAEIVEEWFKSDKAKVVGEVNWDVNKIKEGIVRGGGGWHGKGWLGNGAWKVVRTHMDESGVCQSCRENLVCIDIDPKETQHFATSLANLACQREARADFLQFQEWLQRHGPFDAVVDGANVGLIDQHDLNFIQLNSVVNRLRQMSPSRKLPLVILHQNRVNGGPAQNPHNKKLLDLWRKSGALYATPVGSNDDWYWLYAAVSCKGLLITNDEMRDHLFQLLGTSFFPRWKEKHQVHLIVSKSGLNFHMPPPYSLVIQESEVGNWHVPTTVGDDLENPRQWLCITRQRSRRTKNPR
ncbi:proteinaceous RNase P 1, chloroplastic/mitochondrial-like [Impatiens glandulifera]|uniref:proteinaceous RNase P 1, chloroplastic/mitochondrial-like n=1 Tax=Impatiens glandulifera TaxID=253017 RepID=UPI001FB19FBA|nr:proteinaceous RNase P 1, chloroplastic/mitochondrial-like [Impatiens glandulifera]XP_047310583.1 proteinaceous RNase P 1, chloroplastic/mitochondrial-like [Impatiens glandulifera]XP_047310584.1 proteinaceous RNase P 1, chloroplastic/mitochondrial-like [Impatiens glandulifera]XP_047310586.1 proteinaceous RNase P 1, chloroplastic/mitochondrial-like [Impatiens glandulifera]